MPALQSMTIRMRLWIGFGLILSMLSVTSAIAIGYFGKIGDQVHKLTQDRQSTLMQIMDLRASLKRVAGSLAFYPLTKEKRHRNNYALRIEHTKNIIRSLQTNPALNHDEISTQLVDRLNDELTLSNKTADQLLSSEPGHNDARSARGKIDPLVEKMEDILQRPVEEQETAITLAGNRLIENVDSSNNLVAGLLIVGLAIGWLIAGIISNPVTDAARYR